MAEFLSQYGVDLANNWHVFWICTAYTFTVVAMIWVIGLFQGNHSMMDGYYGFGYAIPVLIAYFIVQPVSIYAGVILLMVILHGGRLGYYLTKRWFGYRNTTGGDQRYFGFIENLSPGYWWKSFFVVIEPQAIVIAVIGLPAVWGVIALQDATTGPMGFLAFAGILTFGIGFFFETVADGQLKSFKQDTHNKGRYLRTGVWTHSRHPNYFGNTAVWWGIWLVAVDGNPELWWTVAGPIFNTIMLTSVLGKSFQDNFLGKRPEYVKLMAETRGFLPLPLSEEKKRAQREKLGVPADE